VIEPTVGLDVSGEGRYEWLSSGHKPFQDSRFECFSVIASRTGGSFAHLQECEFEYISSIKAYQLSNMDDILLLASCQTLQKTRIGFYKLHKYSMFSSNAKVESTIRPY
jgi:hypothetical protein